MASTRIVYFAWVRERIGKPDERIELPETVLTVDDLLQYLRSRGEGYEAALQYPDVIRVAVDKEHVGHDTLLAGAGEVALFPPMTGG